MQSGYQPPKELTIAIEAPRSMKEESDALRSALVGDLDDRGIKATVIHESIGSDADLSVVKWDPGSRTMRWLIGFGEGKAELLLRVQTAFGVDGVMYGWVTGGGFGGDPANAAEAAGHALAYTIATGQRQKPAQTPPKH